jgi:hypothetical protein
MTWFRRVRGGINPTFESFKVKVLKILERFQLESRGREEIAYFRRHILMANFLVVGAVAKQ